MISGGAVRSAGPDLAMVTQARGEATDYDGMEAVGLLDEA
jgi:hypothetical protein